MKRYRTLTILRGLTVATLLGIGTLTAAAAPAHADDPQQPPGGLQVLHIDNTTADMYWTSSCFSTGDVVQRLVNGSWQTYASGLCEYLHLSNLTPGLTYTFRVYANGVPGLYQQSPPTAPISFTTLSAPDSVPPSTPPKPMFSSVTTNMVNVYWGQSTDNVQLVGYYLQQLINGTWTTVRTTGLSDTSQAITGLNPQTSYSFAVIAFDARGNNSARSEVGVVTTLAVTAAPTCHVTAAQYGIGTFMISITVTNTTTADINGWTISVPLASTVTSIQPFNGVVTHNGNTLTETPASYNALVAVGRQLFTGFLVTSGATPPTGFTFNGTPCTGP